MKNFLISRRNFITTTTLLAVTAISSRASQALAAVGNIKNIVKGPWTNWAGNVSFTPKNFYEPSNIEELKCVVSNSSKVRVSGSRHSFSAIVPSETLISLKNFNGISLNETEATVTVGSGVKLEELLKFLDTVGWALPSMGEISQQTVAGLVSTATKGTGASFGSFSDKERLLGIRLVDSKGELMEYNFLDSNFDPELASYLRMALGTAGAIVDVTFRIVRAFQLEEKTVITSVEEAIKEEHLVNNYRYAFYFYPFSNKTIMKIQNKTDKKGSLKARKARLFKINAMENTLANWLLTPAASYPKIIPSLTRAFFKTFNDEIYVDNSHDVMITPRTMKFHEMQYTLDFKHLKTVVEICNKHTLELADQGIYYSDLPFLFRFSRADKGVLLSPAQGAPLFLQIDINAHYLQKGYEVLFQRIENDLVQLGGKPHWGKRFYVNPAPGYGQKVILFEQIRSRLDPENKFQNDFIKTYISNNT